MRAPKIAVTVPREHSMAFREYLLRIEQSGAEPIEVTPDAEPESVIDSIQGLLLPGGGDVDPARYGAEPHPETDGIRPELDALEVNLLHLARDRSLPVLAICRGHQLVNVAQGGALLQHIEGDRHRDVPGDAPAWERESRWHTVRIEPDSRLAALIGAGEHRVNSRHHQAVRPELLARGLRAVAISPDGFVEASEALDGSWLLSVQWHPEREEVISGGSALFEGFVRAAAEQRAIETGDPVLR